MGSGFESLGGHGVGTVYRRYLFRAHWKYCETLGAIGQIVCLVVVLFGGVRVSGAGVEFVPVDAGAVPVGYAERFVCTLGLLSHASR